MPTKRENAKQMMEGWKPWSNIVEAAGYGSGTYEELRQFLSTSGKETYEELIKENARLKELKSSISKEESDINIKRSERDILDNEIYDKKSQQAGLESRNKELTEENLKLQRNSTQLREKGVDDEVILLIREFDHEDKDELIQRIGSLQLYSELQIELESERKKLDTLQKEIVENKTLLTNLEAERNKLEEEVKRLEDGFERVGKIADIAELGVRYGYSPVAFESLLKTVENYLDITPYTTNTRIFEALQEYQNLQQIKEATTRASKENEELKGQLQETKGRLDAIKTGALKAIQDISQSSLNVLESQSKLSERKLEKLEEQQKQVLSESEKRLQDYWSELTNKLTTWEGKLKEIGRHEQALKTALVITAAYYNPETARNIPIEDIVKFAQLIDNWVQVNLAQAIATPSREFESKYGFSHYSSIKVQGLSRFLVEELRKRLHI